MVVCYCWIAHECCTTGSHISTEVKMKIKHLYLGWKNYTAGMQVYSSYSHKLTWFTWAFLLSPASNPANIKANQLYWDFSDVWRSEAQKRSNATKPFLEFSLLKRSAQTKEWKALLRSHLLIGKIYLWGWRERSSSLQGTFLLSITTHKVGETIAKLNKKHSDSPLKSLGKQNNDG